ncbi:O-antigen polymerase [Natrialba magadii ATCC 43099]|nr:O-antigen polymerase [Natrialba magadii ATCC 43099]
MGVNPHNGYLSILLYSGIIGLISYLSIIYQVLLLSIARDESNVLMMSVSISILTESFVEDVMIIGTGFSTIILSMCFGYLIKESEISNRIIIKQKTTD